MLQKAVENTIHQSMLRAVRPLLAARVPVKMERQFLAALCRGAQPPQGCQFSRNHHADVPALRVTHGNQAHGTLLYFHGGAYALGSSETHRGLAGHLAKASGLEVLVPDYRLAPEAPFPAALDDAKAVYRELLAAGTPASSIVLGGDSAGGGLATALALSLRDDGLPLPSAMVLFSPWLDLTNSDWYPALQDPIISRAMLDRMGGYYCGKTPSNHPLISPLHGDLRGLPPVLVQVGSEEYLLNDARRFARQIAASEGSVELEIYNDLWHVFQALAGVLQRASAAVAKAGDFASSHCHF